jgi:tetratricopeptide (TPR) repeat protein
LQARAPSNFVYQDQNATLGQDQEAMLSLGKDTVVRLALLLMALAASAAPAKPLLDQAFSLQQQGKLKEARDLFHVAADQYRASGDQPNLAFALSSASGISVLLGDYAGAITDADQAVKLRKALNDNAGLGADFNTLGRAYQYLGNYLAALERYQEALSVDRQQGDLVGQVTMLNSVGNIHYFLGHYGTALASYQDALKLVDASHAQAWYSWGRKLTTGNIAVLYQRVGLQERALELFRENSGKPEEMRPNEYAKILVNEGISYRRLGDPVKALEFYQAAQAVFRTSQDSDGEIGVLRSIGIARAMDLDDRRGAVQAFQEVLKLSLATSNNRGIAQANLYLGEIQRRSNDYKRASDYLNAALEAAHKAGLVEEQWKSLYALGLIAGQGGDSQTALEDYRKAISIIESVRTGLVTSLKTDFLADKRDVYDSLIAAELNQSSPSTDELLHSMERSRARTLGDRLTAQDGVAEIDMHLLQSQLPQDTVLAEFWIGPQSAIALWVTSSASGVVRYGVPDELRAGAARLMTALQEPGGAWKDPSRELGSRLLNGIPIRPHMIVVPDGPLNIPFEVLTVPGSETLLIEQSDVSYLPSARFLARAKSVGPKWLWPWNRELVALGDPPVLSTDTLAEHEHWQPLPASAQEVHSIAAMLPGRAEVHLGADARKAYLLGRRLEGVPLLHLSSHALVDGEHPDLSRILLASDVPGIGSYLFQEEVGDLDLTNVGLVTLSACDTARGKLVAGEGVQDFSRALLAAGASATVASLWRVGDGPTASLMSQFYGSLGRGRSRAEALRAAKLHFLRSNSELSSPRHWAAFILNGEGWTPTTPVISWTVLILVSAGLLTLASLILWAVAFRAGRKALYMAPLSSRQYPPGTRTSAPADPTKSPDSSPVEAQRR